MPFLGFSQSAKCVAPNRSGTILFRDLKKCLHPSFGWLESLLQGRTAVGTPLVVIANRTWAFGPPASESDVIVFPRELSGEMRAMTLRRWYWDRTEFQKFCLGFGVFFVFGCIWHVRLLFDCSANWWWAKHDLTFLIAHPFLFAPAFGLVLAFLDRKIVEGTSWTLPILTLLFVILAVILTCIDHSRPPPNKLSPWIGAAETGVFMSAIAAFVAYCLAAIWMRAITAKVFAVFCAAAALIVLWIPLRVYADLSGPTTINAPTGVVAWAVAKLTNLFFPTTSSFGIVGPEAKFALVIAFLLCICFVILALVEFGKELSTDSVRLVGSIAAALSALVSMTLSANTSWVLPVRDLINDLDPAMFIAIGVVAFVIIVTLAKSLLDRN